MLLAILQNGGRAFTLDEWKRLVDKDNYDIVYDYDYGRPYRKLIYYAASAPDDSENYFDSEEEEHEEEEEEERRRVSQGAVPPFSHYRPAAYGQAYPQPPSHNRRSYPAPSYPARSYPRPGRYPNRRYTREVEDEFLTTELNDITKTMEELQMEEDEEVVKEGVKKLTGEVLKLDRDDCLLKLLCHLQEKPKDTRDPQDEIMLNLFEVNMSQDSKCGEEILKCPVEEVQLVEAFSYTWQLQNTI